jgi:GTPase SAR1 family protein
VTNNNLSIFVFNLEFQRYYRNTLGAFLVYDITSRSSFLHVENWLKELRENVNTDNVCLTLVGNKSDLRHLRAISKDEAMDFADANGMKFIETSALDAVNITQTFKEMISDIYNRVAAAEEAKEESMKTINVTLTNDNDTKGCCITN